MRDRFALDGIVTMIDARHFDQQRVNSEETTTQVAFADVIVLNKADLVSNEHSTPWSKRCAA